VPTKMESGRRLLNLELTLNEITNITFYSDFVMLQHKFEIENKDGSKETRTSTLCEYGEPYGSDGYSAVSNHSLFWKCSTSQF
jgi:hypothetical protein